jgi:hypothetical protein
MAVLLAAGIATGSLLRNTPLGVHWLTTGPFHLALHVCLFALLTALCMASTRSWTYRLPLFAAVLLLGLGTEFYEHLQDGFPIETPDVLADAAGATMAVMLTGALALVPGRASAPEPHC